MSWPLAPKSGAEVPPLPRQLDVVDKFAKSIAHEMNNVLAAIVGLASVLESEIDTASPMAQDVQGIIAASRKGLRLTKNLLGFAGPGEPNQQAVSVNHLCRMVRSILLRTAPDAVQIDVQLNEDLAEVWGDAAQLQQVFLNLCSNALDAMDGHGKLSVSTRNVLIGDSNAEAQGLPAGAYVRVQISDTGRGMDSETLSRAMEPFFTTKPRGTAAGLGLSLVCWTISHHHGRVTIFSRKGLGTTATIYLPVSSEVASTNSSDQPGTSVAKSQGKTILVIDDDAIVLRGARRLLERLGYQVVAMGAAEGLAHYRNHSHEVDAVILDLVMPERDGMEVLADLKSLDPEVCVIISSGYPMDQPSEQAQAMGARAVMRKPYTLGELAAVLDNVLATTSSPR